MADPCATQCRRTREKYNEPDDFVGDRNAVYQQGESAS
jgi:hypothetical protein